jgi:hypothetical protein
VIGRDAELADLGAFVTRLSDGPAVLLIEGEAGVGKSTLWTAGIGGASPSATVLSCRQKLDEFARKVEAESSRKNAKIPTSTAGAWLAAAADIRSDLGC